LLRIISCRSSCCLIVASFRAKPTDFYKIWHGHYSGEGHPIPSSYTGYNL
jgi:hypothetical protein